MQHIRQSIHKTRLVWGFLRHTNTSLDLPKKQQREKLIQSKVILWTFQWMSARNSHHRTMEVSANTYQSTVRPRKLRVMMATGSTITVTLFPWSASNMGFGISPSTLFNCLTATVCMAHDESVVQILWRVTSILSSSIIVLYFVGIFCPEAPVIPNAIQTINYERHYKAVVHYECSENLRMEDGNSTKDITCEANEQWSDENFNCAG